MEEEFLSWYCDLNKSDAEQKQSLLEQRGIKARLEPHEKGFCVAVAKSDLEKVIALEDERV